MSARLSKLDENWAPTLRRQPQLASTARRYLEQISISLSPSSVAVADQALRMFCLFLAEQHPQVSSLAEVNRPVIEDFKRWLTARPGAKLDTTATKNTVRQRLGTIRTFFDRIIEWDCPDAPARTPIFSVDLPIADDALPKFLDDAQAAALLRAASADPDGLRRLVIHLLLRTGMRAGELALHRHPQSLETKQAQLPHLPWRPPLVPGFPWTPRGAYVPLSVGYAALAAVSGVSHSLYSPGSRAHATSLGDPRPQDQRVGRRFD